MDEPAKPFACTIPDCGMSFTNEDHLQLHTKKHDMVLQFGLEQKAAFVADQTPTPTRFIRNCEEVGLFQDLQNVAANPFDEGFKRAMEAKAGILSLENTMAPISDDVLHTPQMVFPLLDNADPTLFNTQRNITISRSSSDESGTVKEFETTTISKLTNEVRTISSSTRIINTDDVTIKQTDIHKDTETVSYKNNVIRIESNIIRKDIDNTKVPVLVYSDSIVKETMKDNLVDNSKLNVEKVPIMSQKSIDFVVDSVVGLESNATQNVENNTKPKADTAAFNVDKIAEGQMAKMVNLLKVETNTNKKQFQPKILPKEVKTEANELKNDLKTQGYEVVIKLPGGKQVRMKPVEEPDTRDIIRNRIATKVIKNKPNILQQAKPLTPKIAKVVKIPTGTLIPVTLVNKEGTPLSNNDLHNVPIAKINNVSEIANIKLPLPAIKVNKCKPTKKVFYKRKIVTIKKPQIDIKVSEPYQLLSKDTNKESVESKEADNLCVTEENVNKKIEERIGTETNLINSDNQDDDCVIIDEKYEIGDIKRQKTDLERRCAASKRYRERLKVTMRKQSEENRQLREANQRLIAEKAVLKLLITEHMKRCPNAGDIAERLTVLTNGERV